MPLIVSCGECGKRYKVGDDKAGKRIKCAGCGGVIAIPASEEEDPWDAPVEEEYEPEPPPSRRSLPAVRASGSRANMKRPKKGAKGSGGGKGLLIGGIIGGAVLLLSMVGVGGYFAYRHFFSTDRMSFAGAGGSYSVDLTYIPEDSVGAFVVQPAAFLNSDLCRKLELEKLLTKQASSKEKDLLNGLELVLAASGKPDAGKPSSIEKSAVVLHFSSGLDARERFKEIVANEKWQEGDAGGKKYWRYTMKAEETFRNPGLMMAGIGGGGDVNLAMYAPDDRSVVVATEEGIKKMLTTPYKKTPLRSLLRSADTTYQVIVAAADPGAAGSTPSAAPGPMSFLPSQLRSGVLTNGRSYNSVLVGFGVSGANLLKMDLNTVDDDSKALAEKELNRIKGEAQADLTKAGPLVPPQFTTLGKNLIDGTTISTSGSVVTVIIKKPANFDDEFSNAVKPFIGMAAAFGGGPSFAGTGADTKTRYEKGPPRGREYEYQKGRATSTASSERPDTGDEPPDSSPEEKTTGKSGRGTYVPIPSNFSSLSDAEKKKLLDAEVARIRKMDEDRAIPVPPSDAKVVTVNGNQLAKDMATTDLKSIAAKYPKVWVQFEGYVQSCAPVREPPFHKDHEKGWYITVTFPSKPGEDPQFSTEHVYCKMTDLEVWKKIGPKGKITIKGRPMDYSAMADCEVINYTGDKYREVTAEQFAKDFASNRQQAARKYHGKGLVLTGKVAEAKPTMAQANGPDSGKLLLGGMYISGVILTGNGKVNVAVHAMSDTDNRVEGVNVGDDYSVLGEGIVELNDPRAQYPIGVRFSYRVK